MASRESALEYHSRDRAGKIEVVPTKPVGTQMDLALAYTPGVAEPCREIAANPDLVDRYTARRNLVAVVTNGTAVLGLGKIGPRAAKPVMEGKGVLFKRFADIDVFDLEIDERDPHRLIEIIASLEPTFGGINLEDIAAPECFIVERALRQRMGIPVFHDDQHGTAIISGAALLNAAELTGKNPGSLRVTCLGAGAAAVSCMLLWIRLGVAKENITMCDSRGVLSERRENLDEFRRQFARPASDPRSTLAEALQDADVLMGVSAANLVTETMLKSMAPRPIIFALANPDPEVPYDVAVRARPDAIVATGRSDYPNQVNNVLGFPYIFRGALDVRARQVSEEMKVAAAHALAELAKEDVPDEVLRAYQQDKIRFGPQYIIPTPFDGRVLYSVAPAVAKAAMDSGVAREQVDIDEYRERLYRKIRPTRRVLWNISEEARRQPRKIVYPEGHVAAILRAAREVVDAGTAIPILIGSEERIAQRAAELGIDLDGATIVDPSRFARLSEYVDALWSARQRKGLTRSGAQALLVTNPTAFGLMMVDRGDADGLIAGHSQDYPATIRPTLQIIGMREGVQHAAGMYMLLTRNDVRFLADTTINIEPDAETLAETAILAADYVAELGIEARVAMLSFSNFGDAPHEQSRKVALATSLVKARRPDLMVDGEMQANLAVNERDRAPYPFCSLKGSANVLIFPNLDAGNAAYKLLGHTEGAVAVGPFVLGLRKPVNVLQQGATVDVIVHVTAVTVAQALRLEAKTVSNKR